MGVTTLQVNLNSQRMIDLHMIKKHRGIPLRAEMPGYISDDMFARVLLLEAITERLKEIPVSLREKMADDTNLSEKQTKKTKAKVD